MAKIVKANLDGSNVRIVLNQLDDIGLVTAMAATESYIYFTTGSGCLKSVGLAGADYHSLSDGLDNPTDMLITARSYGMESVIYVSTPHDILRLSLDGSTSERIITGMYVLPEVVVLFCLRSNERALHNACTDA